MEAMPGKRRKLEEKVSTTLYDLTHLEINTIIKDEMSASKAPASPRLLLHLIAKKYDEKIISIREKYKDRTASANDCSVTPKYNDCINLLGGTPPKGSGYESYKVLSCRANCLASKLTDKKTRDNIQVDGLDADIKMLKRIETISDDIRRILKMEGVEPEKDKPVNTGNSLKGLWHYFRQNDTHESAENDTYNFDDPLTIDKFRRLPAREAEQYELNLDMRQLLLIKKANDIGTERVVLQTIIGIDGDVTTRIAQSFANQPASFINDMHHEAIGISVRFWENLVNIVVTLGKSIIDNIAGKK